MPVEVDISVHNLELSDRLKEYVAKKVGKIDRYLDILEAARVDLTYDKGARSSEDRQIAQLTVRGKGVVLRAEERSDDIFASVDEVMEKIYRQIERYKGRRWRNRGDGRSAADVAPASPGEQEAAAVRDVISRRKHFTLVPMDENEAIEQMDLLGQDAFFVFLNVATNQVSVLYRRRDGTLGLIDTEAG